MTAKAGIILIIEDDPGAAALQRKCLERNGYRVFTAANRAAAWQVLGEHPVELILLDYKLQEQDTGLDLLRELQSEGRDIPCIVITGFANEQLAIDAFRAGARDFVPKSVTYLDSLPQAVDRVFREIRQSEQLRRSDSDRRQLVRDLGERVKELTLLREASRLIQQSCLSTQELLGRLVELIPAGFLVPERTTARIRLGLQVWTGKGFHPTATMLRVSLKPRDGVEGSIEVALIDDFGSSEKLGFLPEEETLLSSIAEMLLLHFDRALAWEELRRNEQRYRSLVESSTVVLWTADASGQLNQVSPVLQEISGTEADQALGDGWADLMHPEDLPRVAAAWQQSLATLQPHHVTTRVRRESGDYMHCDIRAVPILDEQGQVIEWFGTMHDITQQREYEATLARLAAIVESSDDAIVSTSLAGVVLSWNPGAERIYGYAAPEMLGKPIFSCAPVELHDELRQVLLRIGRGETIAPYETVRIRQDGRRFEVLVRASPIRDGGGRVCGASWIKHELTERKSAEKRRQIQSATLQILADTASIEDAAHRLIDAICGAFAWSGGGLWLVDPRDQLLRFSAATFDSDARLATFGEFSQHLTFERGQGLPGAAWKTGRPAWIGDFDKQRAYPRAMLARELNLHAAVAFPLQVGDRTVGVLDFFGESIAQPSRDDLAAMSAVASQLALFIDRKLTEMQRAQLAAILEASTDFVGLSDPQGELLYINRAGRQMIGLSPDDPTSPNIRQCVPGWVADRLRAEAIPQAIRDGAWTGEAAVWNRSGFEVAVSMLLLAHRDSSGGVEFFSMIGRDITEEKHNRESLVLHNRAMGATSEGIIITGPAEDDAPILYANQAFLKQTGYELPQVIGRNCRFLQGPESDRRTVSTMRQSIQREEPCTVELLNYKADGTPFWNLISITPVRDAEGRVTHHVGTQRDVTERKRLEDQLRQTQKMDAIGSLAGGIAHDFNNMLTVILGYSEMARESLSGNLAARDLIQEIISAAQRSATLTGQLLAFSRRQVIAPQIVDIHTILDALQRLLRPLISENIVITRQFAEGLWNVKVDPSQFEQIVMNLVINARDAMPDGGQLSIATENLLVSPQAAQASAAWKSGEYVVLKISDTGCGMSSAIAGRIFEPFFTTKPKGKGTGMGLATVYGIVKQSGGHITVDSQPGAGTTFTVYFPRAIAAEPQRPAAPSHVRSARETGAETVLLVEDENGVRDFAGQVLREHGYRVLEASRGDEALALLESISGEIDALITDVVMPGMGGKQLAGQLLRARPDLKVLYLSGYSDEILSSDGALEPGAEFLQKPFSRDALTDKLRRVLDR